MKALAPQQARVLDFLDDEAKKGRPFPSCDAIAERMGWRYPTSARNVLDRLVWSGYLWRSGDGSKLSPLRYQRVTD